MTFRSTVRVSTLVLLGCFAAGDLFAGDTTSPAIPWRRHTIDAGSRGADGVRLEDVDGDGRLDVVTGWEEGGVVRAYLRRGQTPGPPAWKTIEIAAVGSPEDAVALPTAWPGGPAIVSASEGKTRALLLHRFRYVDESGTANLRRKTVSSIGIDLDEGRWHATPLASNEPPRLWMFALPVDLGERGGRGVFTGSKGDGAAVGWQSLDGMERADFEPPDWVRLAEAGWIMSLVAFDVDADGDDDLLFSDRKGPSRGVRWLENTGAASAGLSDWRPRTIGATDAEPMFLSAERFANGTTAIAVATAAREIRILIARANEPLRFAERRLAIPPAFGTGKGVRWADLDADGVPELAFTCEHADGELSGIGYFAGAALSAEVDMDASDSLRVIDVGGAAGTKFDRLEALDLDDDGDLDLLTCEERDGLGVIWYENPLR